jgi:acetyl-CoA acetyltransferase
MNRPAIIGASALPVGRYQTPDGAEHHVVEHELLAKLVVDAIASAGVDKSDVSSIVCAQPRSYTRQKYFSTFMANYLRLQCEGIVMETFGNGLTAALAFDKALDEILLGRAKVVLALAINMETSTPSSEHMKDSLRTTGDVDFHAPSGFTPISWYAMDAMRYMHEYNVPRSALASVAVKNRRHASLNPLAQYRDPITLEDVLKQRTIVEPLGLYEVPPRGDGACVVVIASEDVAKSLKKPYSVVRGRGFFHEGAHQINEVPNSMIDFVAAQRASATAYANAGVTAADIDFAEIYAPCTIVEVLASEAIGLTARGRGAFSAEEGVTTLGGAIPISTSGGLTSRGHPPYATPLYNAYEVNEQLCSMAGERQVADARLGLLMNELGNYNAALIHILEAMSP